MHTMHYILPRLVASVAALLVASCASVGQQNSNLPPSSQPLAQMTVPSDGSDSRAMSQLMQGEFALADGDVPAASRAYAQAAALSSDPRVAEASAGLAISDGNRGQAQTAIERMQSTGAGTVAVARKRAQLALMRGHRDEARQELEKVLAPGGEQAWREFAQILADARDPALAGTLLEDLATTKTLPGDDAGIWVAMSQLGEKLNRHLYAERLAEQAASRFATAQAYAWSGHLKLAAGHQDEGLALYAKAVAKDPDDTRLRQMYAAALGKAGKDREALAALGQGPQNLDVLTGQAAYAARLEDKTELARVYETLKSHRARYDRNIGFLLGQLAEVLDKPKAAMDFYADVPADDKNAFEATVRHAVLLDQDGQSGRAHALAQQLQRDYADDKDDLSRAYLLDAQLYVHAGNPNAAVDAYTRGLVKLPDDADLLYGRALSQADRGDSKAAIADLRRVLELKPGDIDTMNALGYTLADENRDLDEAEKLLQQAMDSEPDQPAIIDSWGWLQYRQGHLPAAEKSLRKAWNMRKDPDIGAHLGEVLWKQGRHDDAREIFEQVREEDPQNATLKKTLQRLDQ